MPKRKSGVAQESLDQDSVLDIIYADLRRIETFSSQLNGFGSLTTISHKKHAQRGKEDEGIVAGSANVVLAKGQGTFSTSNSALHGEASEKVFDPKWVNTLAFLDELERRQLLSRDLGSAGLGDFVHHVGGLRVRDIKLIKAIWTLPTVRHLLQRSTEGAGAGATNRKQRRAAQGSSRKSEPSDADLMVDLISVLPHSLQLEISGEERLWAVLDEEFLIVSPSTFMLKHGSSIEGRWGLVGILDAYPNASSFTEARITGEISHAMDTILNMIAPLTRQLLGRPEDCYGVTPLVIYRTANE